MAIRPKALGPPFPPTSAGPTVIQRSGGRHSNNVAGCRVMTFGGGCGICRPSPAAVEARLLLDRALGRRHDLEALVGDGLAGLHREAVGALLQPSLGSLDRRELL